MISGRLPLAFIRLAGWAALAWALGAGYAAGQHQPPPKALLQVRFGPVYVSPDIGVSQVGVDTNVYNDRGEPTSAFTASVYAGARVEIVTRRLWVYIPAGWGYVYYSKKVAQERAINPGILGVSAEYIVSSRLLLYSRNNRWGYTKSRPNFEIDTRTRRLETDLNAGLTFGLTPRIDLSIDSRWYRVQHDQNAQYNGVSLASTLNEHRYDQSAGLSYELTPATSVFSVVNWRQERFDQSPMRDGDTTGIGGGFTFNRRIPLSGTLQAGYNRYVPKTPATTSSSDGLYTNANINLSLRDSTTFDLATQRNFAYSYDLARSRYAYAWYQAGLNRALGSKFDAGFQFQYFATTYAGSGRPEEWTRTYTPSVGFHRRDARVAIYASYWERHNAVQIDRQYTGWRFGFSVTTRRISASTDRGMFLNGGMSLSQIQP